MHSKNVMYRSLKRDNILVGLEEVEPNKSMMVCKLSDFGFARFNHPDQQNTHAVGYPIYMAPEISMNRSHDTKVDIWALGVIAFIILTGHPPYKGHTKEDILFSI